MNGANLRVFSMKKTLKTQGGNAIMAHEKTNTHVPEFHLQTLRRKRRSPQQKLADHLAKIEAKNLFELEHYLGGFIPSKKLTPASQGHHSRQRTFTAKNCFWGVSVRGSTPLTFPRWGDHFCSGGIYATSSFRAASHRPGVRSLRLLIGQRWQLAQHIQQVLGGVDP